VVVVVLGLLAGGIRRRDEDDHDYGARGGAFPDRPGGRRRSRSTDGSWRPCRVEIWLNVQYTTGGNEKPRLGRNLAPIRRRVGNAPLRILARASPGQWGVLALH
jgi:hypothetical protein